MLGSGEHRGVETEKADLRVAVVYPGPRAEGLSSLAVHGLARQLEAHPRVAWDLVFAYPTPGRLVSERWAWSLSRFDLLAISLSFEEQLPLLPWMLRRSGIPSRWRQRDEGHPLLLVGGVAMRLNPNPVLPFVDVVVCGDAEGTLEQIIDRCVEGIGARRTELFDELAAIDGLGVRPFEKSLRACFLSPDHPVRQMVSLEGASFADMHLVETGRGCPVGCRFCALSFSRRPPMFFSPAQVLEAAREGLDAGKRIGLVGASLGSHPQLLEVVQALEQVGADLSPASLHPTVLCTQAGQALLRRMQAAGQRTITLAPEAGSERLRSSINKPCSNEELVEAVRRLAEAGCLHLKLYMMFGLPGEESADLEALVEQVADCREALLSVHRGRGGTGRLSVSLNPFVPKPHTPLAREAMLGLAELKKTRRSLFSRLRRLGGVDVSGFSPRQARLQALVDRAGAGLADLLEEVDGVWPPPSGLLKKFLPQADAMLRADWEPESQAGWRRVELGMDASFLRRERERMLQGRTTSACAPARCVGCGACPGMVDD